MKQNNEMFEDFSELGLLLSLCSPSAGKGHQRWQWCFTLYTYSSFILSDKHIKQKNNLCSVLYIKNITYDEISTTLWSTPIIWRDAI